MKEKVLPHSVIVHRQCFGRHTLELRRKVKNLITVTYYLPSGMGISIQRVFFSTFTVFFFISASAADALPLAFRLFSTTFFCNDYIFLGFESFL